MDLKLVKAINKEVDNITKKRTIVKNKDVFEEVYFKLGNQFETDNNEVNKIVRSRLYWLNKEGVIIRMMKGVYNTKPITLNDSKDYYSEELNQRRKEFYGMLDLLYPSMWSFGKHELAMQINLTEQVSPSKKIYILKTSITNENQDIIEYAKKISIDLEYVKLRSTKNIKLYSIIDMLKISMFDTDWDQYLIMSYINNVIKANLTEVKKSINTNFNVDEMSKFERKYFENNKELILKFNLKEFENSYKGDNNGFR